MKSGLLRKVLLLTVVGAMAVCNPVNVLADSTEATKTYTDSETIKNVQQALNDAGYDCGTADGIAGQKTKDAILNYQSDNGLEKSGNIDDDLLDKLGITPVENEIGVSLEVFVRRYNKGIEAYNVYADKENVQRISEITENDLKKKGNPLVLDDQLFISVNPNMEDKDPVGIIEIWTENLEQVNSEILLGEIIGVFCGIDTSISNTSQAIDIFNRLFDGESVISENGIIYKNLSITNMLMIHIEYDGFDINDKTESAEISSESFVAQGDISLMNFLTNASNNGCSLENPNNTGTYVYVDCKYNGKTYSVKYFVEQQKVYNVDIMATTNEELSDSEWRGCAAALAKSLNPNIGAEEIEEGLNDAINSPDNPFVVNSTLFRFSSERMELEISH